MYILDEFIMAKYGECYLLFPLLYIIIYSSAYKYILICVGGNER